MTPPPPKRRVRTEAQMKQKRLADREKHRENRSENKQRIERIEEDISCIKKSIQDIAARLQALPPTPSWPALAHRENPEAYAQLLTAPNTAPAVSPGALCATADPNSPYGFVAGSPLLHSGWSLGSGVPPQRGDGGRAGPPPAWSPLTAAAPQAPPSAPSPKRNIAKCRCGAQHSDQFDSLDYCDITALYQTFVSSPERPSVSSNFPRNPSLSNMMLHSQEDDPITFFITPFLRSCKAPSIETLLGSYFIAYRLMRWRMNPGPSTLLDVPPWLLPTEAQNKYPHPVVVDYLPWPKLREYLCTQGTHDSRHSVEFYFQSTRLNWPPGYPLFTKDEAGGVAISKEFETIAGDLGNWHLGSPWSEAFPHLRHLIKP